MIEKGLNSLLSSAFDLLAWQEFLFTCFKNNSLKQKPEKRDVAANNFNIKDCNFLGEATLIDSKLIGYFYVELPENCNLEKNRVGLRNMLKSVWKNEFDGTLIVFNQKESKKWRFSYVSDTKSGGTTASKRFTYLLGEGEQVRTAVERFEALLKKNKNIVLADLQEAFSVDKINKEFFDNYKKHYTDFVKALCGKMSDPKTERDFVKKLLGRIVFIYFVQKKGWIGVPKTQTDWIDGNKKFLSDLFYTAKNQDDFYSSVLTVLFFDTLNTKRDGDLFCASKIAQMDDCKIPFLNGGLFDRDAEKTHSIKFPKKLFADLFQFFDSYNFTIDENSAEDLEVAIDPEMLGHIFENLLEDNKDKGAFYTPKEIVSYMCKESLIAYLKTHFPLGEADIETFIRNYEKSEFIKQNTTKIDEKLQSIKVCDPAIGSGAFPMGMLHEIVQARLELSSTLIDKIDKVKKSIIENSIYGVDIENGAVDIARLRFWLSLIVEEKEPIPLPNLDYKIMQGNSLLESFEGIDLYGKTADSQDLFDEGRQSITDFKGFEKGLYADKTLSELIHWYYNENDHVKKSKMKSVILAKEKYYIKRIIEDDIADVNRIIAQEYPEKTRELLLVDKKHSKKFADLQQQLAEKSEKLTRLLSMTTTEKPYFLWHLYFGEVFKSGGFDVVIGNPPYVSTKGVDETEKQKLNVAFGFADDLYYHFMVQGLYLLRTNGILSMITPDTYFTTLTKTNLRKKLLGNSICSLVHLGHDVFESAMVSTAIIVVQKKNCMHGNCKVLDMRGKKTFIDTEIFTFSQLEYEHAINGSFFVPNIQNIKIHKRIAKIHSELLTNYWDKITTSRDIAKNENLLNAYRKNLNAGDWTLVGLVTEGGQGLATANNGKYVGVKSGSKEAARILETRSKKLAEVNSQYKTNYILPNDEQQLWELFEKIKQKHGRDVFGQGYLYKIVPTTMLAKVDELTDKEKANGITGDCTFVPYDKGDKDGNRWYLETPYLIDWSVKNVAWLKENSGKKGQGMPVVRNPQFYFREGFCWTDVNSTYLKCRLKPKSVHDVLSMSLFTKTEFVPEYYIISLINSKLVSELVQSFINTTSHFQINDCRSLPIPVPTSEQLTQCKQLFDDAVSVQKDFFASKITTEKKEAELALIQKKVDTFVEKLYGLG